MSARRGPRGLRLSLDARARNEAQASSEEEGGGRSAADGAAGFVTGLGGLFARGFLGAGAGTSAGAEGVGAFGVGLAEAPDAPVPGAGAAGAAVAGAARAARGREGETVPVARCALERSAARLSS